MSEEKKAKFKSIMSPTFRVSFPHVFKPYSMQDGQEPAYSIEMMFPEGTDLTEMKKLATEVKRAKWGDNAPEGLRNPFKDGNLKKLESYKGMTIVSARTKQRPGLIDENYNEIIDQAKFYAGCWAKATLTCYAYEARNKQGVILNRGVAFGLQNIMKVKDDTAFSGKRNAKDDFAPIRELEPKKEDLDF